MYKLYLYDDVDPTGSCIYESENLDSCKFFASGIHAAVDFAAVNILDDKMEVVFSDRNDK